MGGEHLLEDQSLIMYSAHVLEHGMIPYSLFRSMAVLLNVDIWNSIIIGRIHAPKESHRWVIQDIDNKLVVYDKAVIGFKPWMDFEKCFYIIYSKTSIGFKNIRTYTRKYPHWVNYEWEDNIEILVNPQDEYYLNYFIKPWDESICDKLLIKRSYSLQNNGHHGCYVWYYALLQKQIT